MTRHLFRRQLLLRWYLRQQRDRVRVIIGFLVWGRVRIRIRFRVRVTFNVAFIIGAIVAGGNVVHSAFHRQVPGCGWGFSGGAVLYCPVPLSFSKTIYIHWCCQPRYINGGSVGCECYSGWVGICTPVKWGLAGMPPPPPFPAQGVEEAHCAFPPPPQPFSA